MGEVLLLILTMKAGQINHVIGVQAFDAPIDCVLARDIIMQASGENPPKAIVAICMDEQKEETAK